MFHKKEWFKEQIDLYGTATNVAANTGYSKDVLKEWCKKHNLSFSNEDANSNLLTKEFLVEQYNLGKSVKMISKEFHILMDQIIDANEDFGLKVYHYNTTDILDNKEWLEEMYKQYSSISKLAEAVEIPRTTLARMCRVYGIHKPKYEREKENYVQENYFKTIDAPDKAYFLGLIMADGNIHLKKDNNKFLFSIKLKSTDCDIIYKFADAIGFNKDKILFKQGIRREVVTESVVIQIYNQKFCDNLIKAGIEPQKGGKELIPESVPQEFIKDFIRGYIDGDGSIHYSEVRSYIDVCSTSLDIMSQIKTYIEAITKNPKKIYSYQILQYHITRKKDLYLLCSHFYYPGCVALDRKYQNAQSIINDYLR